MKKKPRISYAELANAPAPPTPPEAPAAPAKAPKSARPAKSRRRAADAAAPESSSPPVTPAAVAETAEPDAGLVRRLAAALNAGTARAPAGTPPRTTAVPAAARAARRAPAGPFRDRVKARQGTAELLLFRVGPELFAVELRAIEEAVELDAVHTVPEMPAAMLGVCRARDHMTPVYSPARALGVALTGSAGAALMIGARGRRVGLAVDDVEDVMRLDLATTQDPPAADEEGIILAVTRRGGQIVAVLDADALVTACLTTQALETV
ncbi:MAG TPA: chemotaxis protein CheW [Gemmatimonadaceae bacterium]|nr:chemotaxis protein CheW [Gemmatimonadaceae bacterium]